MGQRKIDTCLSQMKPKIKSAKLRNLMLLMVKLKNDKVIRDLVIRVQATRIHYNLENTEFEANNAAILPINYKICYIMNNRSDFQQRKNAFINRRESPREV